MSSNFRVRPFAEEISTLRNVMRTMLMNTLQMGEDFVNCHVEWHLFTSWMENAFTNVMRTLDRKVSKTFFDQFNADLNVDEVVGLIIKQEMLSNMIKILVSQAMETLDNNKIRKDLGRSRLFLSKSLQESQKNNLTEALDFVNRALILAPFPADGVDHQSKSQLSFCLFTRAHLLRKIGHYQACELDLYESLQHSVQSSNDKISTLEKRITEEVANLAATKSCHPVPSNPQTIIRKFFNVDAVSDRVHGAAQYINLSFNDKVGRTLITKRKVKPQVSIIAEEPYCSWLAPFLYNDYCSFCMSALEMHVFPCRKCTLARYCSAHCEEESWEAYHSVECKYMAILRNLGAGHFALRCLMTAGLDKSLSILRASLNNSSDNNQTKPCKSFHNNYHDIFTLMARENEIAVMPKMAFLATFLAHLSQSMNLIDESSIHNLAALVYRQLGIGYLNSFFISDHGFGRLEKEPNDSRSSDIKEIGMGLYASASLLSHSCDPNCEKLFVSNKILIVAKRGLKEGEEITISYGPLKDAHSYAKRQEMLETTHSFKCVCDACSQRK